MIFCPISIWESCGITMEMDQYRSSVISTFFQPETADITLITHALGPKSNFTQILLWSQLLFLARSHRNYSPLPTLLLLPSSWPWIPDRMQGQRLGRRYRKPLPQGGDNSCLLWKESSRIQACPHFCPYAHLWHTWGRGRRQPASHQPEWWKETGWRI